MVYADVISIFSDGDFRSHGVINNCHSLSHEKKSPNFIIYLMCQLRVSSSLIITSAIILVHTIFGVWGCSKFATISVSCRYNGLGTQNIIGIYLAMFEFGNS